MLVAVKRDWAALDEVRALLPWEARALLQLLVTLCIRTDYDSAPACGEDGGDGVGPVGMPGRARHASGGRTAA